MRLAAIYISEHFLFNEPQTINLGGKYIYNFECLNNVVTVKRVINENFIPNLFNISDEIKNTELVTAIVGENGVGKTSILDVLKGVFYEYSNHHSVSLLIGEEEGEEYPIIIKSSFNSVKYQLSFDESRRIKYEKYKIDLIKSKNKYQSIYYSPHFDFKDLDDDDFDISFDKILKNDLDDLDKKKTNQSGWKYKPNQELKFKNSLRQILFLSSNLVKTNDYFKNFFNLPNHGNPKLVFRAHQETDLDDISLDVKFGFLNLMEEKKKKETKERVKRRKYIEDSNKPVNWEELELEGFKNFIVECLISVIFRQANKRNTFLTELKLNNDFRDVVKNLSYIDTFLLFLKNARIELHHNDKKAFDDSLIKEILNTIFDIFHKNLDYVVDDYIEDDYVKGDYEKFDFREKIIFPKKEDAIKILELQRKLIVGLEKYFNPTKHDNETIYGKELKIDGFINYETDKKLSSGENSILNFYSIFYEFITTNMLDDEKGTKFLPSKNHYILLLDEADLGFHPEWKKKFICTMLKSLPFLFDMIDNKPSYQIIFTTHDPLTLSDIPNSNVVYLEKDKILQKTIVLNNKIVNKKSFGANITDLLADSFFIEDGLIGDFAKEKINKTLNWLRIKGNEFYNAESFKIDLEIKYSEIEKSNEYNKKIIEIIDEPLVKSQLKQMYMDFVEDNDFIDKEIERLKNLKK